MPGGMREIAASLEAYLAQGVFKVVLQESTPPQNSQLNILIANGKHSVYDFVGGGRLTKTN